MVSALIVAGRRAAERLMVDSCTIRRMTETSTTDPVTGVVAPDSVVVYSGKCKTQSMNRAIARPHVAAEHQFVVQRSEVHIPGSATAVNVGDVIDLTAALNDPNLVGRRLRVTELLHKSFATAQRLGVEEVTA